MPLGGTDRSPRGSAAPREGTAPASAPTGAGPGRWAPGGRGPQDSTPRSWEEEEGHLELRASELLWPQTLSQSAWPF